MTIRSPFLELQTDRQADVATLRGTFVQLLVANAPEMENRYNISSTLILWPHVLNCYVLQGL